MPGWLKDAVFYEIYPQSFYDSNSDGIGDIVGIIEKLDEIKELGCNALWINPCFLSPFKDAGYDVMDYYQVAPRYGSNDDLIHLFRQAHQKGIKVLLDLVPGHTSDQHEWFKQSCLPTENEYSKRYVWTDSVWQGIPDHPYVAGNADRDGVYMLNFFLSQPALNYGWLKVTEPWMSTVDSAEALATREDLKKIMRFWLDAGCDGFRVDMADSLVKNDDENKSATAAVWADVRSMLDKDYPEAALVSEWSNPQQAINGGKFHMDFYLDHRYNGYNTLLRDYETPEGDHSYFKCDSGGDITRFLADYLPKYQATKGNGYISMFTCNHDTPRPARTLSERELKLAYGFILTMPGVPFIYYGDEIGMAYQNLSSKEGGYQRTGSRTPMQWSKDVNAGFSKAAKEQLYLPVDERADAPDLEGQKADPDSLYNTTKQLIALRHQYADLQADQDFEVVYGQKSADPFIYRRGEMLIAINPDSEAVVCPELEGDNLEVVYTIGNIQKQQKITLEGQSFAIFKEVK